MNYVTVTSRFSSSLFQALIKLRVFLVVSSLIVLEACSTGQSLNQDLSRAATEDSQFGLLLMAHGGATEWNAAVEAATFEISDKYPVEIAFGMADAGSIEESVKRLESRGVQNVGVIRMFVSGESWRQRTKQILGIEEGAPNKEEANKASQPDMFMPMGFWKIETGLKFFVSEDGLADADEMDDVLVSRIQGLSREPEREVAVVIAHGTGSDEEDARWVQKITQRTEVARDALGLRDIKVFTLREDWFAKRGEAENNIRKYIEAASESGLIPIVVPFRVHGFGPYARVLEGLDYKADGLGLLPHENVGLWVENQAEFLKGSAQNFE